MLIDGTAFLSMVDREISVFLECFLVVKSGILLFYCYWFNLFSLLSLMTDPQNKKKVQCVL